MDSTLDTEFPLSYAELPKGAPRRIWAAVIEWTIKDILPGSIPDLQRIWPIEESRQGENWSRRGKQGASRQLETN